jgi:aspartate/methionine/tyrosine aminotransferase
MPSDGHPLGDEATAQSIVASINFYSGQMAELLATLAELEALQAAAGHHADALADAGCASSVMAAAAENALDLRQEVDELRRAAQRVAKRLDRATRHLHAADPEGRWHN